MFVSTLGSDLSPCTQFAPCRTFNRAYRVAQPGATVEVAAGTYPAQQLVADSTKTGPAVVFRPAPGTHVSVTGMVEAAGASFVELRDMEAGSWQVQNTNQGVPGSHHVTFRNVTGRVLFIVGRVSDISVLGGSFGPLVDGHPQIKPYNVYSDSFAPTDILIDGVLFHDFTRSSSIVHTECLQIFSSTRVTVRNSRFTNCDGTASLAFGGAGAAPLEFLTIENNWFDSKGDAFYAAQFSTIGSHLVMRYNSFSEAFGFNNSCPAGAVCGPYTFVGNYGPWSSALCGTPRAGATFAYNVLQGGTCSPTDTNVPALRYVNAAAFDLHLAPGSEAIGRGDPSSFPPADIDGQARMRGTAPDAGADEF